MRYLILLLFPLLMEAKMKTFEGFSLFPIEGSTKGEIKIEDWDQVNEAGPSTSPMFIRTTPKTAAEQGAEDGLTVSAYEASSNRVVRPKNIIVTTYLRSSRKTDEIKREVFIYGLSKNLDIQNASYCEEGLKKCTTVTKESCIRKELAPSQQIENNLSLLKSHYLGFGSKISDDLNKTFKNSDIALVSEVCEKLFDKKTDTPVGTKNRNVKGGSGRGGGR